ncbi:MAG: hypothetical protein H0T76_02630 [Nannocystis sp.]|nr:hypothetical protein [Nannocystis sp.]MBA3545357.1 hypothetical protein [Nannocystis sp.]
MTTTETPDSSGSSEAPPASCDDQLKNQDESDVDCGGGCGPCPEGQACNSAGDCASMACLAGVCVAASCVGDADCAALDGPCSHGTCDPQSFSCQATPIDEGVDCDDGTLCSTASSCAGGTCTATAMVDCSGFDSACTQGQCAPESGACLAIELADGTACEDGDACTAEETCNAGSCVSTKPGALFFEDFSNPAPGWELDKLWEMGPAVGSPAAVGGFDPADDHSPGDDRGLAGAGIGALDTAPSHEPWCLSSPPIDTTTAGATLWVSFWRHLHTPAKPKVIHTVDVWTGVAWKNLESGYDKTINDIAWTFVKFDASGIKSKGFRVRICSERIDGAADHAGWSVDDLTVAPVACTPG